MLTLAISFIDCFLHLNSMEQAPTSLEKIINFTIYKLFNNEKFY